MEDSSLEELLANVNALSMKKNWSDLVVDCEENKEDTVLGIIWSDEETCSTDYLGYNHGDLQDVATLQHELSKHEPVNYLSSQFVTIRRKSKRKGSIFSENSQTGENSERKIEDDLVDSIRTLSFDDCVSTAINENPIIDCNKSMHEDEDEICTVEIDISKESAECSIKSNDHFERTERYFSKAIDLPSSSSSENGVNKDHRLIKQNVKSGVDCASEITGNILTSVSVTGNSTKYDAVPADAKLDRCNEEEIKILVCRSFDIKGDQDILVSDDESDKCISNIKICSPSNKTKVTIPVTTISSGSGSADYDCVWESEDESVVSKSETKIQENNYTKHVHVVQLSNKGQHTVNLKTPITEKEIGSVTPASNKIVQHSNISNQLPKVTSTNVVYFSSSDDDFEAFLADIRTPKPKKTTSQKSMKDFVMDDWIDSSDDECSDDESSFVKTNSLNVYQKIPPNKSPKSKTMPLKNTTSVLADIRTPKPKNTTSQKSMKDFVVDDWIDSSGDECSDDESSFVKTNSLNVYQKIPPNKSPKSKRTPLKNTTLENTPLTNPSVKTIKRIMTPYMDTPRKSWQKKRDELVKELFNCYNETIFGNKLPSDLQISWNKQMTKTAGFCYYIGSQTGKKCRIELSDKVVDSCDRIRDTLIHELCHAATWLIDGVKAGHGPHWKLWALKAKYVHSDLPPISRCHSYEINYKFTYKCIKCDHRFGRHSKSINTETSRCPYCLSRLELLPRLRKDGTPAKPRAPSKFSLFVKDNYRKIKENEPGLKQKEIMKELSKRFAQASLKKDQDNP